MMEMNYFDNIPVIRPAGAMVYEVQEELRKILNSLLDEQYNRIIIDFSNVELVTSGGLGILFTLQKELETRKGKFALISPKPAVLSSIQDWRLDRFIDIYPSVQDASNRLKAPVMSSI